MPYTQCVLDGYTYSVNPAKNVNPPVRAVTVVETLGGRCFTDWGSDPSRQDVNQSWPVMPAAMYASLKAKYLLPQPLAFTDTDGTQYTVLFESLTHEGATTQEDAFLSVKVLLRVVSSP